MIKLIITDIYIYTSTCFAIFSVQEEKQGKATGGMGWSGPPPPPPPFSSRPISRFFQNMIKKTCRGVEISKDLQHSYQTGQTFHKSYNNILNDVIN